MVRSQSHLFLGKRLLYKTAYSVPWAQPSQMSSICVLLTEGCCRLLSHLHSRRDDDIKDSVAALLSSSPLPTLGEAGPILPRTLSIFPSHQGTGIFVSSACREESFRHQSVTAPPTGQPDRTGPQVFLQLFFSICQTSAWTDILVCLSVPFTLQPLLLPSMTLEWMDFVILAVIFL